MKKTILLAVIALGISATSCRKERTCECKTTETEVISGFGAQTNITNSSYKTTKAKQKKKEFKWSQQCFSTSTVSNDSGGSGNFAWTSVTTSETTCDLK
jgi:hypothetical protein